MRISVRRASILIGLSLVLLSASIEAAETTTVGNTEKAGSSFAITYSDKSSAQMVVPLKYLKSIEENKLTDNSPKTLNIEVTLKYNNVDLENRYVLVQLDDDGGTSTKLETISSAHFITQTGIYFSDNQKVKIAFTPNNHTGEVDVKIPLSSRLVKNGRLRLGVRKESARGVYPHPCRDCSVDDLDLEIVHGSVEASIVTSISRGDQSISLGGSQNRQMILHSALRVHDHNTLYRVFEGHVSPEEGREKKLDGSDIKDQDGKFYGLTPVASTSTEDEFITVRATIIPVYETSIHEHMLEQGFLVDDGFFFATRLKSPKLRIRSHEKESIVESGFTEILGSNCAVVKIANVRRNAHVRELPFRDAPGVLYSKGFNLQTDH